MRFGSRSRWSRCIRYGFTLIVLAAGLVYLPQLYSLRARSSVRPDTSAADPGVVEYLTSKLEALREAKVASEQALRAELEDAQRRMQELQAVHEAPYGVRAASASGLRRSADIHSSTHQSKEGDHTDGFFNGLPLRYHSPKKAASYHSVSHCIGDNFLEDNSWMHKTCQYRNLCFDTQKHDFVLFASPEQLKLEEILRFRNLTFSSASTSMFNNVSIGGLNPAWTQAGMERLKWFPERLQQADAAASGFYELPDDATFIPYHSLAGFNPGHLVWDDWLPIYTLLSTFELLHTQPVLMRYVIPGRGLWASCEHAVRANDCREMMHKFMPLMGVDNIPTIHDFNFTVSGADVPKSRYVCSRVGAAGMGMLTDHGLKGHGWVPNDLKLSHNQNRAADLYGFRNYMLSNIGVPTTPLRHQNGKIRIVFSTLSSDDKRRSYDFKDRIALLKKELGDKYDMEIVPQQMSLLSVVQQAELISTTAILVTLCGGGAVSATFLPKGAALFLFFDAQAKKQFVHAPARLDWDYFNHLGYIRTHWLPRAKPQKPTKSYPTKSYRLGPSKVDLDAFVRLMDHELSIISDFHN